MSRKIGSSRHTEQLRLWKTQNPSTFLLLQAWPSGHAALSSSTYGESKHYFSFKFCTGSLPSMWNVDG
ncbi:hypothetical protein CSPAE12_11175 [Colletotrichum incanum]|nr:hypothetical protein CSPAE12_11175 [Colletotrichum incanum]